MNLLLPLLCFGPMLAALGCYIAGRRSVRLMNTLVSLTGVAVFATCLGLNFTGELTLAIDGFCGFGLHLKADGFRAIYAGIAAFMWMMTGLFAPEYFAHYHNRARYSFFNLMTLGATLGVFLSDDLYTTFIFFEVMSFTSYTWVAHEETPGAMKAAGTYLAVAVIGGLTTLMGLFLLWYQVGTLAFDGIRAALGEGTADPVAAWLIVVGFAAKAGLYPLHIWLPKAHPVAPAPASALLSGILTKSGVFGLIVVCSRLMPGSSAFGNALLVLAVITMFLGALLALLSVDLKRTLACSSMSQIGFITVGLSIMVLLGEEGSLAAYGAVMHMMNHSLIKLVLFMAAGVVYMNLHQLNLNDIRGFGRKKPLLHIAFLLGALSIGGVPPIGSGYNSKSLLHEAILEYIAHLQQHGGVWAPYKAVEIIFLVSGGLTVAYMTKLYICLFWQKHPTRQEEFDARKHYMNAQSAFALLGSALVLPLLGALPGVILSPVGARSAAFFGQEASHHAIAYFSSENLIGAAESITIGALVYLLIVRKLLSRKEADGSRVHLNLWPARLDLEELIYRPLVMEILPGVAGAISALIAAIPDGKLVRVVIPQGVTAIVRFFSELPEHITVFLRRTVFRARREAKAVPVGNRVTWGLGRFVNACARLINRVLRLRQPLRTDFEYVFAASWRELQDSVSTLTISISFGLLLLGIGLLLTCIYLLL